MDSEAISRIVRQIARAFSVCVFVFSGRLTCGRGGRLCSRLFCGSSFQCGCDGRDCCGELLRTRNLLVDRGRCVGGERLMFADKVAVECGPFLRGNFQIKPSQIVLSYRVPKSGWLFLIPGGGLRRQADGSRQQRARAKDKSQSWRHAFRPITRRPQECSGIIAFAPSVS